MKTTLLFFALLFTLFCSYSQTTYVPDYNFEAYLEANSMGNGITNDNLVTTANISGVTSLGIDYKNINDLTGLSGFTSLTSLNCTGNNITSLDLSANTSLVNLYCNSNYYLTDIDLSLNINLEIIELGYCVSITNLNVDSNTALKYLNTTNVPIVSLNLTQNTSLNQLICLNSKLTTLNVSQNITLNSVDLRNNKLTSLDFSNNRVLGYIWCSGNLLQSLNVKNGFNNVMPDGNFYVVNNPSLTCINVDNKAYSDATWFNINGLEYFSENCALGIEEFNKDAVSVFPNPSNDKMNVQLKTNANYHLLNLHGQEIKKGNFLSGNNDLDIHSLSIGLYFLNIETSYGQVTKKIFKL